MMIIDACRVVDFAEQVGEGLRIAQRQCNGEPQLLISRNAASWLQGADESRNVPHELLCAWGAAGNERNGERAGSGQQAKERDAGRFRVQVNLHK